MIINKNDIMSYIKGNDIYGSKLLKKIKTIENYSTVSLSKSERRLDIIAKDYDLNESFISIINPDYDEKTSTTIRLVDDSTIIGLV